MTLEEQFEFFTSRGLTLRVKVSEAGFIVGTDIGHVENKNLREGLLELIALVESKEVKHV